MIEWYFAVGEEVGRKNVGDVVHGTVALHGKTSSDQPTYEVLWADGTRSTENEDSLREWPESKAMGPQFHQTLSTHNPHEAKCDRCKRPLGVERPFVTAQVYRERQWYAGIHEGHKVLRWLETIYIHTDHMIDIGDYRMPVIPY